MQSHRGEWLVPTTTLWKAVECGSSQQRASGVEEDEPDELTQLLTSVAELRENCPVSTSGSSNLMRSIALDTRMRALNEIDEDRVMEDLEEEERFLQQLEADGSDKGQIAKPVKTIEKLEFGRESEPKKPKKDEGDAVMAYLNQKSKKESELKQEEFKVRAIEAENKRLELQLQKERQDLELEERRRMNEFIFNLLSQKNNTANPNS